MVVLDRSPDQGARGHANHLIYVALLFLGYVLFYGWLLARSDWLPYIMDNNESFSSLWHASNLFNFGLERSFGLTDEAYGFAPEAHPYVYTHQGNFPRLFAWVLYAVGARTVEAQIVVTTFTVGLAALLLAFTFLSRLAGNCAFAALACTLMFTDYVLVAQWQVVTYRVWHAFFAFAVFLCVDRLERDRNIGGWLLLALASACLFYFELIFATFIAAAAGLYVLFRNRKRPGTVVLAGTALGAGGLLSVFALCTQIVLYMGWDNFLRDVHYSFVARNQFSESGMAFAELRDFMVSNRIVFWYNLLEVPDPRNPLRLLASVIRREMQIHTPHLVLLLALPAAIYAAVIFGSERTAKAVLRARDTAVRVLPHLFVFGHLMHRWWRGEFGWVQLISLVLIGVLLRFVWRSRAARGPQAPLAGLAVLAGILPSLAESMGNMIRTDLGQLGPYVWAGVLAYVALVGLCVLMMDRAAVSMPAETGEIEAQPEPADSIGLAFFGSTFVVLLLALGSPFGLGEQPTGKLLSLAWISRLGFVFAAAVAAVVYLLVVRNPLTGGGVRRLAPEESKIPALRIAIAVNVAAIIVMVGNAFLFEAGYRLLWHAVTNFMVPEGLTRLLVVLALLLAHGAAQIGHERLLADPVRDVVSAVAPFLAAGYFAYAIVYLLSPGYVLTGYRFRLAPFSVFFTDVLFALGIYVVYRLAAAIAASRGWRAPRRWGVAAGALVMLQWANNQAAYIAFMPPDGLRILKTLAHPPYKGASFVSNAYAAPIAAFTGKWAYLDHQLGRANMEGRDGAWRLKTEDRDLWFADRDRNPEYRRPQYFICLMPQSLYSVLKQLHVAKSDGAGYGGCGQMGIVRYAGAGRQDVLPRAELIAMDTEGRRKFGYESWAILRLDWGPSRAE